MEFNPYSAALGHRCVGAILGDFSDQRLDLVAKELLDSSVVESGLFAAAQGRKDDVDII